MESFVHHMELLLIQPERFSFLILLIIEFNYSKWATLWHFWARLVPMEMMLMGEKVFAPQALSWGLINRMTSSEALLDEAKILAHSLASGPTKTLSMIRQMAWAGLDNSWGEQLALERDLQRDAGRTDDFKVGVMSFLTKQVAKFTGR